MIEFIAGIAIAGVIFTANRAIDVWKASVVPNPKSNPELDAVRAQLSQFDPEQVLAKLDELDKRSAVKTPDEKLVPIYDRMNVLSKDMMEFKAELVKLKTQSGTRRLLGGAKLPEVTDG